MQRCLPSWHGPSARELLHGRGYAVLSHVATANQCKQALASLHEAAWDTNGLPSHALADGTTVHDSRRQQTSASRAGWISVLTALLAQGLDREGLLECTTGKKQVVRLHGLKSLRLDGYVPSDDPHVLQEGDQGAHTDESRERYDEWMHMHPAPSDAPLSVILAIMPGTRLRIFADNAWHILKLAVGDAVVFRGNVLHSGVGYAEEHLRVHAYVYPPGYDHISEVDFEDGGPMDEEGVVEI